jgi:hypothetical protein
MGTMPKDICEILEVSQETVFRVVGWTPADLPNELASLQAELSQFRNPLTGRLYSLPGLASEGAVMTPSLRAKHSALKGERRQSIDSLSIVQRRSKEGLVMLDKCLTYDVDVEQALEFTAECLSVLDPDDFAEFFTRMLNSVKQRPNQLKTLVKFLTRYLSDQCLSTLCDKTTHNQTLLATFQKYIAAEGFFKGVVQRLASNLNEQLSAIEAVLTYFLYFSQAEVERLAAYADCFGCQGSDLPTLGVLQLKLCEYFSLFDDKTKASPLLSHLKECITATHSRLTSALGSSNAYATSCILVATSITEFCETNAAAVNPLFCSHVPILFSIQQHSFSPLTKELSSSSSRQVELYGFSRLSTLRKKFVVEFDNQLYYVRSGVHRLKLHRVDLLRDFACVSSRVPLSYISYDGQIEGLRGADYVYMYSRCLFTSFMRFCTKTQAFEQLPTAGMDGDVVAAVEMKITGCLYFVIGDQVYEFDQWELVWRDLFVHVPVEKLSREYSIYKSREYSTSFFLVNSSVSKVFTIDVALNRCDAWRPVIAPIK